MTDSLRPPVFTRGRLIAIGVVAVGVLLVTVVLPRYLSARDDRARAELDQTMAPYLAEAKTLSDQLVVRLSPIAALDATGARSRTRVIASSSQFGATAVDSTATPQVATDQQLPRAARTFEECAALATPAAQQLCYAELAAGDGPAAANALYALAVLERDALHDRAGAIRTLRGYQRRFADGPLGPEVALALIAELRRDPCSREALVEIGRFLEHYPGDGRAAALQRLRATLARGC